MPILVKIDQEMRPRECAQHTDTLTDANRFYNLFHAICCSYGTGNHTVISVPIVVLRYTVSLPQKDCHELLRQERLLEIRERQSDYLWASPSAGDCCLPGQIRAQTVKELPVNEQLEAEKYAGMPWDIDPTTIETLLPFLAGIFLVLSVYFIS